MVANSEFAKQGQHQELMNVTRQLEAAMQRTTELELRVRARTHTHTTHRHHPPEHRTLPVPT